MAKTMRVHDSDHTKLKALQMEGETLTETLHRLLEEVNPFAGLGDYLKTTGAEAQLLAEDEANKRYEL